MVQRNPCVICASVQWSTNRGWNVGRTPLEPARGRLGAYRGIVRGKVRDSQFQFWFSHVACRQAFSGAGRQVRSVARRPKPKCFAPSGLHLSPAFPAGREASLGASMAHEIKLDGYRMAARIDNGRVQLLTRTGLDWSAKYPSAIAALAKVNVKAAYIDGELGGVDDAGLPSLVPRFITPNQRNTLVVLLRSSPNSVNSGYSSGDPESTNFAGWIGGAFVDAGWSVETL
jgi:hypothetical protein